MRNCSLCSIADRPSIIEDAICKCKGGDNEGHSPSCPKIEHTVKLEVKFQSTALTKKQLKKGWRDRPELFRGKPAIQRFVCRGCDAKEEVAEDIAEYMDDARSDDDEPLTMYQLLCL